MKVGKDGTLLLPEDQRKRWGLRPGADVLVWETPEGLVLRPADPPLAKIYLEPTTTCNLQCSTCMRNSWDEPGGTMSLTSYDRLLRDLEEVSPMPMLSFWGIGEPLMHPGIVEMIRSASGRGAKTELITNGLLLNRKAAEGLLAAGLDRIVVSIDGVSRESYSDVRCGADLEVVKKNVAYLHAVRVMAGLEKPDIGIEFVLTRRNVSELPQLPDLARFLGAHSVVVTNVLPYTESFEHDILYGVSAAEWWYSSKSSTQSPEVTLPRVDVRPETREALLGLLVNAGAFGLARPSKTDLVAYCPFAWEGKTAIAWNGEVSPCISLMHSHTCFAFGRRKAVKRYSLGNVWRDHITDIWNGEEYCSFRRRVIEFDFSPCNHCDCDMAEANEEDCFGSPFPTCGDCLWARGVVVCP
jgi:MoaA/NifB/PqqE/SkfB family radical SAM enzyme